MKSSRRKPWKKAKTPDGWKYKYDYQDLTWGITRVRATFNTAAECQAYHESVLAQAQQQAKGDKPTRYFGQALIRYLSETKNKKLSHGADKSNALALRWPFQFEGEFYLLEDLPIDDSESGIVAGFKNYIHDLSFVIKRSYLRKRLYHQRKEEDGSLQWYEQPDPKETDRPAPRKQVDNLYLIKKLEAAKGRGPFSSTTLHQRQTLLKTILNKAKTDWRWIDEDLSDFINEAQPNKGIINFILPKELEKLVENSDEMFGHLIRGAAYIGWRQANIVGLTWNRVIWPKKIINDDGEEIFVPGYLVIPQRADMALIDTSDISARRIRTKNGDKLETIMTDRIENLLRELWKKKHPESDVVFHKGDGLHWGDFKKRWKTLKRNTGIDPAFRWHDLRHTWATHLINQGVSKDIIKEEQGWKDDKMVDRYAHIQHDARYSELQAALKS